MAHWYNIVIVHRDANEICVLGTFSSEDRAKRWIAANADLYPGALFKIRLIEGQNGNAVSDAGGGAGSVRED